jgi:hypothetical protein
VVGVKRISFNSRFVNEAENDLVPGKIHTIRQNYGFWKKFEGQDVALFTWEGTPYRSKQRVFCVKRIVGVQKIAKLLFDFYLPQKKNDDSFPVLSISLLSKNDGFEDKQEVFDWFSTYPDGEMAVLHFTEFRY